MRGFHRRGGVAVKYNTPKMMFEYVEAYVAVCC